MNLHSHQLMDSASGRRVLERGGPDDAHYGHRHRILGLGAKGIRGISWDAQSPQSTQPSDFQGDWPSHLDPGEGATTQIPVKEEVRMAPLA